MIAYYVDAYQVVEAQLATENFLHELTNMIAVPDPPDGCVISSDFSCATHQ